MAWGRDLVYNLTRFALMEHERDLRAERIKPAAQERLSRWSAVVRLRYAEIIYILALAAFAVLALLAHFYRYFAWDLWTARFLQNLPIPGLFAVMRAVSLLGDRWTPFALTALTVAVFLMFHRRHEAAGLLLSAGLGELLNRL